MASYRGHLTFATPLGAAYGCLALLRPEWDWGPICLGAGFCAIGGVLPDLDSDSGVPQRELFGTTAAGAAALIYHPLTRHAQLPLEQALVLVGLFYFLVRGMLARVANQAHGCKGRLAASLSWGCLWATVYMAPLALLAWLAHVYFGGKPPGAA